MITLDKIRNRLLDEIKRSGIKKTELANKIGVSHQAVSEYLTGRAMPALDTFAK
ncbi:MAG: helix-turn-helix domain-containing protein, partial [Clostridia bacterium]|nr:helix-turn-helix domain-containing protein [Clostridia bacterium]